MDKDRAEQVIVLCREAAEHIGEKGSFRARVLMQMLLLELEQERAAQGSEPNEGGAVPTKTAARDRQARE